ncbi:3-oxoacyl-ACP synthase III family protein [Micromonospora sp. DT233]|uniref:3-oxoacyl-ACP synthase III family protein n=1 Tax=Micromonospora sp. DT233 TaxID=3393432 RepID=UPI003CF63A0E
MSDSDIRLLSVGSALPGPPVDNATLARHFGMPALWEQWIDVFVGTSTRHLAVDLASGEVRTSLAELGEQAARRALDAGGMAPADIDLLVLGTANPDLLMPATVNMVAEHLGIDGIPTYQLQSGCAGAFQALDVAVHMLAGGGYRNALVIAGEVCAKHFDVKADLQALEPAEMVNAVLFGDGAAAVLLTADPVDGAVVVRKVLNRLCGLGREPGQVVPWFGLADRASTPAAVREDYKAIELSVPIMAAEVLDELVEAVGWTRSDVDFVLPPQLSGRMSERIRERLDLKDAVEIGCVAETGNVGNALPFLQLERLLSRMLPGDRAVGFAIESSKWIKGGFALERM